MNSFLFIGAVAIASIFASIANFIAVSMLLYAVFPAVAVTSSFLFLRHCQC
jgi:hypothetical protein